MTISPAIAPPWASIVAYDLNEGIITFGRTVRQLCD